MTTTITMQELNRFIVQAKAATYVGNGSIADPCRIGSHDLKYHDGSFSYLDSYFGGTDFIGQEVVYHQDIPVWALNYYGRIIEKDLITGAETGQLIKTSLSKMYLEGRFLGEFEYSLNDDAYFDTNKGTLEYFTGKEWITRKGVRVYELIYHGGLIIP